jgi:hypothetical protein
MKPLMLFRVIVAAAVVSASAANPDPDKHADGITIQRPSDARAAIVKPSGGTRWVS